MEIATHAFSFATLRPSPAGAAERVEAIRTKRLLLEQVTRASAVALWRLRQSAHLREYQDVPRFTREEFERSVASRPSRLDGRAAGRFDWLIRDGECGTPMGWVSLRVGERERGVAEIGYSILRRYRGAGYAREATLAVVEHAFARAGNLRLIDACCLPANEPSRRLLAHAGFAGPRLERDAAVVRGRPVDIFVFELTRERWAALRLRGARAASDGECALRRVPLLRQRDQGRAIYG